MSAADIENAFTILRDNAKLAVDTAKALAEQVAELQARNAKLEAALQTAANFIAADGAVTDADILELVRGLQRIATYDIGMSAVAGEMSDIARKYLGDHDARVLIAASGAQT